MAFKLIKTYPNSPELGTEINTTDGAVQVGILGTINLKEHPEYWEEIKPKITLTYQIIAYRQKSDPDCITTRRENGLFLNARIKEGIGEYPDDYSLDIWDIYSVKRLSDGEIFTVGDSVQYYVPSYWDKESTSNIIGFDIYDSKSLLIKTTISSKWAFLSDTIRKKVKQPIFTTSDGVEIFEGDTYSCVKINDVTSVIHNCATNSSSGQNPQYIYFSTKEKAERYINQNKKIYSKQDLINMLSKTAIIGVNIWE